MRLLTRRKTPTEELKDAAIQALVNALDDDKRAARPGTKGVRAVAAGAVIYTAGRAAFKGRRFVREQLSSDTEDDQAEDLEREEEEARASEEPEAEEYGVDEEEDEPEAVEEGDEEPEAYEEYEDEPDDDEDTGDDEPDREPHGDEQEEPRADEDAEEPEARREPDDETSSKTPTPLPERKSMRRPARKKGAQPSLKLPKQRRARTWVSQD